MDVPSENWLIANAIGVLIYQVIFALFDKVMGVPLSPTLYAISTIIYVIFAILDFYVYNSFYQREEKKSVGQELRDMLGSIGATAVIMAIAAIYMLRRRRALVARIAKRLG